MPVTQYQGPKYFLPKGDRSYGDKFDAIFRKKDKPVKASKPKTKAKKKIKDIPIQDNT